MRKAMLLAALCWPAYASAATGYYLVSTYDVEGQKSIDFKYWHANYNSGPSVEAPSIGFGYGVTSRWYTELYATYLHVDGRGNNLNALTWQNDYLLTQGQYPFDLALHSNVGRYRDAARGYSLEIGPVLQTDVGRTQLTGNLFLQRDYRAARANTAQLAYQWQVKYRWKPSLQFGAQGFGELGPWNDWLGRDKRSHRLGPAVFGSWQMAAAGALKYEAAYLVGKNAARTAKSFAMRVQYVY